MQKGNEKIKCSRRLSKTFDVNAKFILFNSFVLSNYNFCPVVYNYCVMVNLKKMDNIEH